LAPAHCVGAGFVSHSSILRQFFSREGEGSF
jgi:hypothetical protein